MSAKYLTGAPVPGFYGFVEADFGDPSTPAPYCRVTPSRIGAALLPFHCPRCAQRVDFTDADLRACYRDERTERPNYFCPTCGWRFYLNEQGNACTGIASPTLDAQGCAPSIVECIVKHRDGTVDLRRTEGGAVLGAAGIASLIDWARRRAANQPKRHPAAERYLRSIDLIAGVPAPAAMDEHLELAVRDHRIHQAQLGVSLLGLAASLASLFLLRK